MEEAESQLQHGDIVGTIALGRRGLGVTTGKKWRTSNQEERRHLVQKEVRAMEEQSRMVRATGMKKQGNWLNWEGARLKKLSWNDIWCMEPQRLQFQLKSVYDVLPTPSNLATWGMTDDPACKLCGRPANLEHILSSCSVALADGRYTWRHDKVLSVLADTLENSRKRSKRDKGGLKFINFVKAGEQSVKGSVEGSGVLGTAEDWQLRADLNGRMTFPPEIAVTNQRPDIVIWSSSSKQAVLVELTVPWEDRINDAYERKQAKYQDLVSDCQQRGWRMWCLPVEVGCRGFVGQSMWRALRIIGITGIERRRLIGRLCREAEVASMWLWKKREEQWRGQHQ
ncbi:uncharacterized protein [Argopecten irradians]|uniref:uncharacterized protein n=1 Tax=Argopecten irradians TaxID=31199 RepID=UPI003712302E